MALEKFFPIVFKTSLFFLLWAQNEFWEDSFFLLTLFSYKPYSLPGKAEPKVAVDVHSFEDMVVTLSEKVVHKSILPSARVEYVLSQ